MSTPAELLDLATELAREAGDVLRSHFGSSDLATDSKSTPTDPVTEADRAAERLIRERLAAARPDDAILGEEGGDVGGTSGLRWIVDPLDGTVNFLFGIPAWTVSIACEDARGTIAGAVFDPCASELWSARREGPALRDGVVLPARPVRALPEALVATGFGYDSAVRAAQGAVVARLLPHVRDIRRVGSAAQDLAWTAAGRYDAFYERGPNLWDVAAGALVCERAGLARRVLPPTPPAGPGLLVAPPELVDDLAGLLR